ncbi:MAG: hypothetical protein AB8I08_36670, partial [Sandaracinaceae bacterium]
YSRGHVARDGAWSYVQQTSDSSVFPNGYVVLTSGVVVSAGANTLNVDVPQVSVARPLTVAGESLQPTLPGDHGGGFSLLLVPRWTRQRQYVAQPSYRDFSRYLVEGTDVVDGLIVPGTYDLVYARGHVARDNDWSYVQQTSETSVYPNGYVVVSSCVDIE